MKATRSMSAHFLMLLALAFAVCTVPRLAYAQGRLAASVQPYLDDHTIAGAVMLVANSKGVVATEVAGLADPFANVPMTADRLFNIASMTKTFTATAIMMLQDQGKLSVDDPVSKYIPEFAQQQVSVKADDGTVTRRAPASPLLIRQLLSHMSGFTNAQHWNQSLPIAEQAKVLAAEDMPFDPGAHYEYCNKNFLTAGRIIEVVSGKPYADFIRDYITKPLGMEETTFWPTARQLAKMVKPYRSLDHDPWFSPLGGRGYLFPYDPSASPIAPNPAGSLISCAADLSRFCRMLLNGGTLDGTRILSESAVKQMSARQTPIGPNMPPYGFGMALDGDSFGHGGAWSTDMRVYPKQGLAAIILMQNAGYLKGKDRGLMIKPFDEAVLKTYGKPVGGV